MGSNPTRRAITPIYPKKSDIRNVKEVEITTFLQLFKQYIKTDTKYLQKISQYYYFVIKINNKIIKQSLKSSNLKYCNIEKLKILKYLVEELKLDLNFDKNLTIHLIEDENDTPESVENFKKKVQKLSANEIKNGNLNSITIDATKSIKLKDAIEKFTEYKKNS